jgi:hypothetical protein
MRLRRYCWVACLIFITLFRGEALAAAVPAYNGKMNAAVGGIISQKVGKWGFAANDPRFGATLNGVGAGVATVALAVVGGTVATVGWPAVLIGAGVTALVTGAVSLAQDSLYKWLFNSDGTVTRTAPGVAVPAGTMWWYWYGQNYPVTDAGANAICQNYWAAPSRTVSGSLAGCVVSDSQYVQGYPISGLPQYATQNASYPPYTSGASSPVTSPLADAIAALPESEASQPLSNEALAAAVNAAWKAMPATTPNALPWSATDPVTPAEVATWKAANPSAVPTVSEALAPVAAPGATTVPITQPGTSTQPATGPATTPGTGTQVDLGPNPNIGAPTLENTPTAQSILDPILNLFPDLKNFSVPSHSSECPKPSFSAFSQTYVISSHCDLFESNRSIIEAAMLLVWTIAAVFIVLRA